MLIPKFNPGFCNIYYMTRCHLTLSKYGLSLPIYGVDDLIELCPCCKASKLRPLSGCLPALDAFWAWRCFFATIDDTSILFPDVNCSQILCKTRQNRHSITLCVWLLLVVNENLKCFLCNILKYFIIYSFKLKTMLKMVA